MILAHITFLIAEYVTHSIELRGLNIQISGVIATAYAALIMGNYGKTKITPKVEAYMEKFRNFFAFVCNALVFLMMGMVVWQINIPFNILIPIVFVLIAIMLIARALSIYLPLGFLNIITSKVPIPLKRQHLLSR